MEGVKWPMNVSLFFDEAQAVVARVIERVDVESAILDDWNAGVDKNGKELKGPRIVWGWCGCRSSGCGTCGLFRVVGGDKPSEIVQNPKSYCLRPALCLAGTGHFSFLPQTCLQRQLNCKTLAQYREAYVAFVLNCCDTEEKMHAEIAWIIGFRLLYLNDVDVGFSHGALLSRELEMKREIVGRVMQQLVLAGDSVRLRWLFSYNQQNQDFWRVIESLHYPT